MVKRPRILAMFRVQKLWFGMPWAVVAILSGQKRGQQYKNPLLRILCTYFFFFCVLQIVYENRSFGSVNIGAQTRVTRYRNTSEAISIIAKEYFKKEKNVHRFFFSFLSYILVYRNGDSLLCTHERPAQHSIARCANERRTFSFIFVFFSFALDLKNFSSLSSISLLPATFHWRYMLPLLLSKKAPLFISILL